MKRYSHVLFLIVLGTLIPLQSMSDSRTLLSYLEECIDLTELSLALASLYRHEEQRNMSGIAKAVFPALNIGRLPISLSDDRYVRLEDIFSDSEVLRTSLSKFIVHLLEGSLTRLRLASLLHDIHEVILEDQIVSEFRDEILVRPHDALAAAIAFLESRPSNGRSDSINLEQLSYDYKIIIESFFIVPRLNAAINKALRGERVPLSVILDSLHIRTITKTIEYWEEMDPDGVREVIEQLIKFVRDNESEKLRRVLAGIMPRNRGGREAQQRTASRPHTGVIELFVSLVRGNSQEEIKELLANLGTVRENRRRNVGVMGAAE